MRRCQCADGWACVGVERRWKPHLCILQDAQRSCPAAGCLLANGLVGILSGTEHTLCPRNSWHLGFLFSFFFLLQLVGSLGRYDPESSSTSRTWGMESETRPQLRPERMDAHSVSRILNTLQPCSFRHHGYEWEASLMQ